MCSEYSCPNGVVPIGSNSYLIDGETTSLESFQYSDIEVFQLINYQLINETCTVDIECSFDLGLFCIDGKCQCQNNK